MNRKYLFVFFTIVHFVTTRGITRTNYADVKNVITEEERRGNEKVEELEQSETKKQKLVAGSNGPNTRTLVYLPPENSHSYGGSSIGSSGLGHSYGSGGSHQGGSYGGHSGGSYGSHGGSLGQSGSFGGHSGGSYGGHGGLSGHGGSFGGSGHSTGHGSTYGAGLGGHYGGVLSTFGGSSGHGSSYPSGSGFLGTSGHGGYDGSSGHGGYGGSSGHGGYGGSSGHGVSGHGGSGGGHGGFDLSHKGLALKGFLIPLAGIALLGAAAALTTNPVLLQLGVLNGRRRRRSLNQSLLKNIYPSNPKIRSEKL